MLVLTFLAGCQEAVEALPIGVSSVPNLVNAAVLDVRLDTPAAVSGTCTAVYDPEEVHVVSAPAGDTTGDTTVEIAVYGLLADERYRCELTDGTRSGVVSFDTDRPPSEIPDDLILSIDDGVSGGGYTLFNHAVGDMSEARGRLVIVDREGRVRWYWEFAHFGGDIDASLTPDGRILLAGGYGLSPTIVQLGGEVDYVAAEALLHGLWHHHAGLVPSGTYYALAEAEDVDPADPDSRFAGFEVEERDPVTDRVEWLWTSQSAVDAGTLPVPDDLEVDSFHANAVIAENPADPGGVWISLRAADSILRIDKASGNVTWRMSPATLDWTLLDDNGDPAPDAQWFYGQHAPELVGDTLYVYDNGTGRPGGGASSRAVAYTLDMEARTLRQAWSWEGGGWYEPIWGDIDLLPNGHVLVTRGHCADCNGTELSTRWVELDQDEGPVWQLEAPTLDHMGYRAERLDGCAIFANTKYCPELLDR